MQSFDLNRAKSEPDSDRVALYILAVLTAIAAVIRSIGLFAAPVDLDEGYTVLAARLGLITPIVRGPCDRNPIAAHLPHAIWAKMFGGSQGSLELLSYLAGVLLIPVIYLIGRELFSRQTGLIAAGLAAISTFHIFYSQYIRIYSVAVLVGALTLLYFCRWFELRRDRDGIVALTCAVIVVNLHYYAAMFIGAGLLFLFAQALRDRSLGRPALLAGFAVFFSAAPTVIWQVRVLADLKEPTWMAAPGLNTFASIWYHLSSRSIPLMILLLSLFVLMLLRAARLGGDWRPRLLVGVIFIPVAVPLVFSIGHGSVFHLRYFIYISVPFLLMCAAGIGSIRPLALQRALVGLAAALALGAVGREIRHPLSAEGARPSPLFSLPAEVANAGPDSAVVFTSKCGFVSAQVSGLVKGPRYLLKSADDAWVLKCFAGKGIEVDQEFLGRFNKIVLVNQGCPPTPARTAMCREDALAKLGFKRTRVWNYDAVCQFER